MEKNRQFKKKFLLKLNENQDKRISKIFDGLDFIIKKIKEESVFFKTETEIKLFLLRHKNIIDALMLTNSKEAAYDLFVYIVGQWDQEIPKFPIIKFDEECGLSKKNVVFPIPRFGWVCFDDASLNELENLLSFESIGYSCFFYLMKIEKMYYVGMDFYEEFYNKSNTDNNESLDVLAKYKNFNKKMGEKRKFDISSGQKPCKKNINNSKKNKSVSIEKKQIDQVIICNSSLGIKESLSVGDESMSLNLWKDKRSRYINASNGKKEMSERIQAANEILAAFNEMEKSRDSDIKNYLDRTKHLQNGHEGKFGMPQSRFRNGTYGINSMEPDFEYQSRFRSFN